MSLKLLKQSVEGIPENTLVSLRTLKDCTAQTVITPLLTVNCSNTDYIRLNLLADTTIDITGATKDGHQIVIAFFQADTIIHNVLPGSSISFGDDIFSFPEITQRLGALDRYIFMYDSQKNTYGLIGYSKGF